MNARKPGDVLRKLGCYVDQHEGWVPDDLVVLSRAFNRPGDVLARLGVTIEDDEPTEDRDWSFTVDLRRGGP